VSSPVRTERRSLARVVQGTIHDAFAAGLDDLEATRKAITVVQSVRRDMTAGEAIKAVERLRID